jgi:hypothetical protein
VTTTVTAATTMTEPAAMAKAAAASITTAVESEANSKRTVEGRPIARIAIVRIVITRHLPKPLLVSFSEIRLDRIEFLENASARLLCARVHDKSLSQSA